MTDTQAEDPTLIAIEAALADIDLRREQLQQLEERAAQLATQLSETATDTSAAAILMAQGVENGREAFDAAGRQAAATQAALTALTDKLIPDATLALDKSRDIHAALCRQAAYDEAARQSAAAQARLREDYPDICEQLLDLLSAVTVASAAVEAANRDRPPGAPRLEDPEAAVRDRPATGRRVVAEEEVYRWVICDTGRILSEADAAARVHKHDEKTGYIAASGAMASMAHTQNVELRPCILSLYEVEQGGLQGERLANLVLPGLTAGDHPFWEIKRSAWVSATWQPSLSTVLDALFAEPAAELDLPHTRSDVRLK